MATLLFSFSYITGEPYLVRFHVLVISFVFSIKLLILGISLLTLLLGWDMLGVTSFLLVVYYNNSKGFNAGILTVITNRIGDGLLLISLGLLSTSYSMRFYARSFRGLGYEFVCRLLVGLAAITKSAQIPFSA
jgi:NADH-ubiquinone oxidoreductase chain 5